MKYKTLNCYVSRSVKRMLLAKYLVILNHLTIETQVVKGVFTCYQHSWAAG